MLKQTFGTIPALISGHAAQRSTHPALMLGERSLDYAELDALMDVVAASLEPVVGKISARRIAIDDSAAGEALTAWLAPPGTKPQAVAIQPDWPFNIIYSSGTTGTPKGIVQPHSRRWSKMQSFAQLGYGPDAVSLVSTPFYSNFTLSSLLPTMSVGGTVVLMAKFDAAGQRFIRSGDVGRFDEDGFLVLLDRKKDLIISGGFNVYPSDLEAVLSAHTDVAEVAVLGVPSQRWGETPVAFVVLREAATIQEETLRDWANGQLGKAQRVSAVKILDSLPRNALGKLLKRELRDAYHAEARPVNQK